MFSDIVTSVRQVGSKRMIDKVMKLRKNSRADLQALCTLRYCAIETATMHMATTYLSDLLP